MGATPTRAKLTRVVHQPIARAATSGASGVIENDALHRTGAIYSLAASSAISPKPPGDWKTMIITLSNERVLVDLDGQRITEFNPSAASVPRERKWFEPEREPERPQMGYLGLQNHDPGDIVRFKEVSVRSLRGSGSK